MKKAIRLILLLACTLTLAGKSAGARDLTRFFEQESWLAYGAFAMVHTAELKSGLIQVREDNYRFIDLDSSFAIRGLIAAWELSEIVRGRNGGPIYPISTEIVEQAPNGAGDVRGRILSLLCAEARQCIRHIPDGSSYRMTVLVVSAEGEPILERSLTPLAGEISVSVRATNRFNARLPLSGVDVAANAVAPFVITQGPGNGLSFRELVVDREFALKVVAAISEYSRTFKTSPAARRSLRKSITRKSLTACLQAMVARGEI